MPEEDKDSLEQTPSDKETTEEVETDAEETKGSPKEETLSEEDKTVPQEPSKEGGDWKAIAEKFEQRQDKMMSLYQETLLENRQLREDMESRQTPPNQPEDEEKETYRKIAHQTKEIMDEEAIEDQRKADESVKREIEDCKTEFGKDFDKKKTIKFWQDTAKRGIRYPNLKIAHLEMTREAKFKGESVEQAEDNLRKKRGASVPKGGFDVKKVEGIRAWNKKQDAGKPLSQIFDEVKEEQT